MESKNMEEKAMTPKLVARSQLPRPKAYEVETRDVEKDVSEQMSKAIHLLPEAWNCEDINVVRCRLHVVAEPEP